MSDHKFTVGQMVQFSPGALEDSTARGKYTIVRLMPSEARDFQYRVRSSIDGRERVVRESQLARH
jgi:hypothetical protein